jgi:hypothetical protein
MAVSNLSEAVAVIDTDAGRYGNILLCHAAAENASAILIGPVGGETTRVAYRIADDDPWFDCVPPPARARHQWLTHLLTGRGLSISASKPLSGKFVQRVWSRPSIVWQAQADSLDRSILLIRDDGGVAT